MFSAPSRVPGMPGSVMEFMSSLPHSPVGLFSVLHSYDLTCLCIFSSSRPLVFLSHFLIPITFLCAVSPARYIVNVPLRDSRVRQREQEGLRQRSEAELVWARPLGESSCPWLRNTPLLELFSFPSQAVSTITSGKLPPLSIKYFSCVSPMLYPSVLPTHLLSPRCTGKKSPGFFV